jgi:tetrahydromethanopterin S-methyltransferase subunit G
VDGWLGKLVMLGILLGIVVGVVLAMLFVLPTTKTKWRRRR